MSEEITGACLKCGALLRENEDWRFHDDCPYVSCDDVACRAVEEPLSMMEAEAALEHWRGHSLLHGCSHGS